MKLALKPGFNTASEQVHPARVCDVRLQRRADVSRPVAQSSAVVPPIVHEVLQLPGHPLNAATRTFMEPRFGHDFSRVRVHANAKAVESERAASAVNVSVVPEVPLTATSLSLQKAPDQAFKVDLQEATPEQASHAVAQGVDLPTSTTAPSSPVFLCTKSVAKIGNHAFFRIGGTAPGNPTFELEHDEYGDHCPCGVQGWPTRDYTEDKDEKDAPCVAAPGVTLDCLLANYNKYPRGKYCALGPNSNTYAHWLASKCGADGVHPKTWVPGFDDAPPKDGTANPALDARITLLPGACQSIDCNDTSCHL